MPAFSIPRTFWEWTQTALLSGNLVWTTLCLGGYRPETMVVSWGLTGLLLTVHLLAAPFSNLHLVSTYLCRRHSCAPNHTRSRK
jgi:hypothetical protein